MDIKKFITEICELPEQVSDDTELIESGLLDSLAVIELVNALEDEGIVIHITRIDKSRLSTPASIEKLIEELKSE